MARLIDADRLLRDPYFQEDRWPESHLIRMAVREQRTVDAVPVVHGRWILKETCGPNTKKFHCSVCNKVPKSLCTETYCPNCGAKMNLDQ